MGTKNIFLTKTVIWLGLQNPNMDDEEQNENYKEMLMALTYPNDDIEEYMELMISNMEQVFIYFIQLQNIFSRHRDFYPEFKNFFTTDDENGFFAKILEWLENFEDYMNKDNNFADVTDLLVSWMADVDFVNSKLELIKDLLIQYLQMKDIIKKYPEAYNALLTLYY